MTTKTLSTNSRRDWYSRIYGLGKFTQVRRKARKTASISANPNLKTDYVGNSTKKHANSKH